MRFRALDGWRGIAALLVALYHLQFYNHLQELHFIRNSFLFVDFFFVLSGFVIGHAYSKRLNTKDDFFLFIFRRIGRLWPLHIFVLLLFIILELIKYYLLSRTGDLGQASPAFTNDYSLQSILANVFLIHSLGLFDSLTWNFPSWSISVEFYTYLIFLVILALFKSNQLIKVLIVFFSLAIIYFFAKDLDHATYDYGIFRCTAGFFLGLLVYKFHTKYSNPAFLLKLANIIEPTLLACVTVFVIYFAHGSVSLIAPFLFALMVYIFSLEQGTISKFLKTKPIQKLGEWSYSIYMIHAFILVVLGRILIVVQNKSGITLFYPETNPINSLGVDTFFYHNLFFMDIMTILYLILVIFISSITYKLIERKGMTIFKKLENHLIEKNEIRVNKPIKKDLISSESV